MPSFTQPSAPASDSASIEATQPLLIHQVFEAHARLTPEAAAVECEGQTWTYAEINHRANRIARRLRKMGVGPGMLVGIGVSRSAHLITGMLGILKAGGAYVPLDPDYPLGRLEFMASEAALTVLLTERKLEAQLPAPEGCRRIYAEDFTDASPCEAPSLSSANMGPESVAYVIFTSGSTGKPKGAMVTHGNLVRVFQSVGEQFHFRSDDVGTLFHSYSFDASVWEIWIMLFFGAKLVIVPYLASRSPEAYLEILHQSRVTVATQTISAFKPLMAAEEADGRPLNPALRYIFFGGEALYPHALKPWFDRHGDTRPRLVNLYGITEATILTTFHPFSLDDLRDGPNRSVIGSPLPGLRAYLLDEQGRPVAPGCQGEIYLAGPGVGRGYLNRPDLTAARFLPDPQDSTALMYKSGDLGRLLPNGEIESLGRADQQVKIRGFRIELGEIEAAIVAEGGARAVAVVARKESDEDTRLAAYIVPAPGARVSAHDLRAALGKKLPPYMIPAWFVAVDALPLNPNGKLDAKALPSPTSAAGETVEYAAPRTPEEQQIAAIWSELLGITKVGIHDNFFDLGGHSLLAVQIISRIRATLGANLPVSAIFDAPELEALARRVAAAPAERSSQAPAIPRIPATDQPPLSFAQEYLWLVHQMDPATAAYNIPLVTRLTGTLDAACLERSLNEIIRRHDILRAAFPEAAPLQRIAPSLSIPLPVTDLGGLDAEAAAARVRELATADSLAPFNLTSGPLVRARLLRLGGRLHVLLLNLHHIVADGISTTVVFTELAAIYRAFSEGKPSPLPELALQYPDYAAWQRTYLQGPLYERQLAYWRTQLEAAPAFELPPDHPREATTAAGGGRQVLALPRQLKEAVEKLGRAESATLYMTLLAAFNLLLFRRTGQDDLCVGTPTGGRAHVDLEKLIGFFNNTLVMRTRFDGDPTFRELLARVRKTALDAYAAQDIPFAKLVEELNPERGGGRNPFFTVFFNLLNFEEEKISLPGLVLEPMQAGEVDSIFDLTLYVREMPRSLELIAVYNAGLYDEAHIDELLRQMQALLVQVTAAPDRKLSELSLLTPEALAILPDPRAALPPKWDGPVHEHFAAHAARTPDRPAAMDEHGTWTYGQLEAAANRLAASLARQGITRGDVVAVYGERGIPFAASLLGILRCGAAFTVLDPAYPAPCLAERIGIAKPAALVRLDPAERLPEALSLAVSAVCTKGVCVFPNDNSVTPTAPAVRVEPGDLAYIVFTSGSTGAPKAVAGTHLPLAHFIRWHAATFGLTEGDRFAMLSGLSHDPVLRDIFTPLCLGATLCIPSSANLHTPGWIGAWLRRLQVSAIHVTPAMAQLIGDSSDCDEAPLPELRHVFFGGDRLTQRHLASLRRIAPNADFVNFYGATETPQAMGYFHADAPACARDPLPLGRGIDGVQLLVLNAQRQPAGIGELGEIHIRTPYLSRGYCGDPEQTRLRFLPNPFAASAADPNDRLYRTGDLGRYLPDGTVDFAGRADRQLKIRGFRVEPAEIERAIAECEGVRQAHVLALGTPGAQRLVAYVAVSNLAAASQTATTALREAVTARLPRHAVPEAFVLLDTLPLTPNGKVDAKRLPAPEPAQQQGHQRRDLPTSDLEQQLVTIWEDLLERAPIGIHDNFFDLGGHSLLAVRLFVQIQKLTGVMLPLAVLFEAPTVAQLAKVLRANESQGSWRTLVPIKTGSGKPPLFCLHPVGGNVLCYRDLANHLDAAQPLFGLQARGLDGDNAAFTTLEEMAAHYIKEIRTVEPHGPYFLAGLSNGGYIAYEMARQLRGQGEKIALLALLDSYPLIGWNQPFLRRLAGHLRIFWRLPAGQRLAYLRGKLGLGGGSQPSPQTHADLPDEEASRIETAIRSVREANRRLVADYRQRVQPYPGKAVLFTAGERYKNYAEFKREPSEGWRRLIGEVEVVPVPGDHEHILAEPHVRTLGPELQARIDRAIQTCAGA